MSDKEKPDNQRLREHPKQRFAHSAINVDLQEATKTLRQEPGGGEKGHRQQTLYKSSGYTVSLFAFDCFTRLEQHKAKGIVNIQVLRGKLKVTADNKSYQLGAGQMLFLAPQVPHDVIAEQESEMLLSVDLVDKK